MRQDEQLNQKNLTDARLGWWWRFAMTLFALTSLNFLPLAWTWRAFESCGFERIGLPLTVFERGGYAYTSSLYPENLMTNLVLAVAASHIVAHAIPERRWPKRFSLQDLIVFVTLTAVLIAVVRVANR